MPINIAKNHFIGKDGIKRLNCAQSIVNAYKEKYNINDETLENFKAYGGGRAPGGVCGAYFASKYVLEKHSPDKINDLRTYFLENAGSLNCSEIKANKKLSCLGCVEKAAEFLKNN